MRVHRAFGDRVFDGVNVGIMLLICIATLYPFVFVLSSSISSLDAIARQQVFLLPVDLDFSAYVRVVNDRGFASAYLNSIWYTVVGTSISVLVTSSAAYALSRRHYSIRSGVMLYMAITLYFSGGIVPEFLLMNAIGLYNSRWVMVTLGAVSVVQLAVARVYFQNSVPDALTDSAKIDGANDLYIFFRIALPISKAIVAVLTLQYAVGLWNEFFRALIYLPSSQLHPLTLYLRRLLITGTTQVQDPEAAVLDEIRQLANVQQFKYASIMVTVLPIVCLYPFLQKYFASGILIGAVKE